MSETLVLCGGTSAPKRGAAKTLRLNLGGSNANVSLRIEDISRRMVADIPDVLTDLLEVATYVYCADQLVSRGGEAAQALGADWRRQLNFVVPVREPDLWTLPEAVRASCDFWSSCRMRIFDLSSFRPRLQHPGAGTSISRTKRVPNFRPRRWHFSPEDWTRLLAPPRRLSRGSVGSFW
jgi:hypothetical protein